MYSDSHLSLAVLEKQKSTNKQLATKSDLTGTLTPHSNGPLYSNTVTGTLAVDGWAVTFGTAWVCLQM